jgi:Xaa-Pro aminopeptidase
MNHLQKIASKLEEYQIDAMLITSYPGELYATGFHGEGSVVITKKDTYYFTDSRYIESAEKQIKNAAIAMVDKSNTHNAMVKETVDRLKIKRLGFEDGALTVAAHDRWQKELGSCELIPAGQLLDDLRASKDEEELQVMRDAQRITDLAFTEILNFIKPGMTEREVSAKLIYDQLRFGADKMSFDPIVVTGANGSLPHGIPGDTVITKGSFLTMDFGCIVGYYCSDMTRTIAVGEPTDEMKAVYDTVLKAQLAGIAFAKAGVTGKAIDGAARQVIENAGYGNNFGHGFGHSLGLEIHEAPNAAVSNEKIMPVGAVISAEPGIYLSGRFGVRIEDVIILKENGCEVITHSPKELIILP